MAVAVLIPALVAVRVFSLASEARALRDAFADAADRQPSLRVKASVGNWLLGAAGLVTRLVPEVPIEATTALDAVHWASIGVYTIDGAIPALDPVAWLERCDARMQPRGWRRLVTVTDGNQRVVIYTRASATATERLPLCLGVADGHEWVFVSVELDAEGLDALTETLGRRAAAAQMAARSDRG